jgi:glycine/D-amino acid oxidase-like deaminating enzyme
MAKNYSCVVIGGGVAGLMTAARLGAAGWRVALVERDLLGAGATTNNHGVIHSGALYARWHPEIVAACQQAQLVYRSSSQECLVATESCWYAARTETMHTYQQLWRDHDIAHSAVDMRDFRELIRPADEVRACSIAETVIDTHALLIDLAARCAALGVEVMVGTGVQQIVIENGTVRGVQTARELIHTPNAVLCTGIGTKDLLDRSGSTIGAELSSRLEMMMAYPGHMPRPIIGLEFGWPAIAPTGICQVK